MIIEEMPLVEQFSKVLKDAEQCEQFKMILESFLELRQKALYPINNKITVSNIQSTLKLSDGSFLTIKLLDNKKCLLMFYDNVLLGKQEFTGDELIQIYNEL